MRLKSVAVRMLRSRLFDRGFRTMTATERTELLNDVWALVNKGLKEEERYMLMQSILDRRRLKNYSTLSSVEYARSYGFFQLLGELKDIPGDLVECGVGRGVSLASIVYAASMHKLNKKVYAFDSFAGFPVAHEEDIGTRVKEQGVRPEGWSNTSPALIRSIFAHDRIMKESLLNQHLVDVEIVPGFFESTLANNMPAHIAFLHVDCDLYESTREVLECGFPRMSPGGVVLFDEYNEQRWPGATKAADELCSERGLTIEYFEMMRRYGVRMPRNAKTVRHRQLKKSISEKV